MGIDKILIVDKDFAFVNRLKNGLQQFGQFIILTAPDGQHAFRLLSTQKISLVVTALDIPKMDGLELLAAMSDRFPNVLTIVSTSLASPGLQKISRGDSLFTYLNKPFDHVRLHSLIIKALDCRDEIDFRPGFYPSSYLPLVHVTGKSCLLEIQEGEVRTASLCFFKGMPVEVSCGGATGPEVLDHVLGWAPAKFRIKKLPPEKAGLKADPGLTGKIMQGTGMPPALVPEPGRTEPAPPAPAPEKMAPAAPLDPGLRKPQPPTPAALPAAGRKRGGKTGVLIVDASNVMRAALEKVLAADPGIEIAGEASDGKEALELVRQTNPNVVLLDTMMPGMDGMAVLKHMMILSPVPVIMLSAVTREGTAVTFDTLRYGAVDFMAKPSNIVGDDVASRLEGIIRKIHLAAAVKIQSARYVRSVSPEKKAASGIRLEARMLVCMGAGEGSYGALLKIIPGLSPALPAALLVILRVIPQHVDAFLHYLDNHCMVRVERATEGKEPEGAVCYLASGSEEVSVAPDGSGKMRLRVKPLSANQENGPINKLMFAAARFFGKDSAGVILSGSGGDGAEGLAAIRKAGGSALVLNPDYCLYKEMAEHARRSLGKGAILTETKIAETLNRICSRHA
jgi:two-component system chemotaxis response regulator CheB